MRVPYLTMQLRSSVTGHSASTFVSWPAGPNSSYVWPAAAEAHHAHQRESGDPEDLPLLSQLVGARGDSCRAR